MFLGRRRLPNTCPFVMLLYRIPPLQRRSPSPSKTSAGSCSPSFSATYCLCDDLGFVGFFKFQVSSFKFQVSSLKFQVSIFKFQVSSFKFQASSFNFSSFKFRVSSFKFFLFFRLPIDLPAGAGAELPKTYLFRPDSSVHRLGNVRGRVDGFLPTFCYGLAGG